MAGGTSQMYLCNSADCSEQNLQDIENQVRFLFDEFISLTTPATPASSQLYRSSGPTSKEIADSPIHTSEKYNVSGEHEELFEDDLEPDSEIMTKGLSPQKQLASNGSHDPSMTKLALKIQEAGDALYQDYGGRVEGIQSHLVEFVTQNVADLTYENMTKEIDKMLGRERSWTNFVMALYVGRRVCAEVTKASSGIKAYFQRYVSQSYSQAMQQAGGLELFVKSRGQMRT